MEKIIDDHTYFFFENDIRLNVYSFIMDIADCSQTDATWLPDYIKILF